MGDRPGAGGQTNGRLGELLRQNGLAAKKNPAEAGLFSCARRNAQNWNFNPVLNRLSEPPLPPSVLPDVRS
jgi:hypothetical protein